MRPTVLAAAALAASWLTTGAVAAPQACENLPALLSSVDFLLREPAEKPRFWRDLHASDAAYLAIRYRGLDDTAADALLDGLNAREKRPERLDELLQSHARTQGRLALIASLETSAAGSVLPQLGPSALRALVVEDGGGWLIAEMKRWLDATPDTGGLASTVTVSTARAIADADDATKSKFADAAVVAGLWQLAFAVNAQRDNLTPLVLLVDFAPPGTFAGSRGETLRYALSMAEMRDGFDMTKQPAAIQAIDEKNPVRAELRKLYRLTSVLPQGLILMTLLNQTGEMRLASELASDLLKGVADGRFDPKKAPDAMFIAMVEGVDRVLGSEQRQKQLASFMIADPWGQQGANAAEFADGIVTRAALAAVVAGAGAAPARPLLIAPGYDWEGAVRIAELLRDGQPVPEADRLRAADLLAGAQRFAEAIALLNPDDKRARSAAAAIAGALDRACDGVLSPTLPLNPGIYRFAPRP